MIRINELTTPVLTKMYDSARPYMLVGKAGCAKTSVITQFAKAADLGLVVLHLTTLDAPDVRGFLIPQKGAEGEGPIATFTKPPLLSMIERTGKSRGIVFLDEFLQADHIVQKAIGPTLSERMVGEYMLPDGWVVWAASNRVSDKAGVNRLLGHITNRVGIIEVGPDMEGHCKWMASNGVHPMIIAFARANPGSVYGADAPKHPDQPFCTPRSLTYANDFLQQGADGMHLPSDPVSQEIVQGFVGATSTEMFAFFKVVNELPTIEQILEDPMAAKVPSVERLDANYAAVQMVVHHAEAGNTDKLFTYVERLNKEMQVTAAKQLIDKSGGALLNSPALSKWITNNRALIMATMSS